MVTMAYTLVLLRVVTMGGTSRVKAKTGSKRVNQHEGCAADSSRLRTYDQQNCRARSGSWVSTATVNGVMILRSG